MSARRSYVHILASVASVAVVAAPFGCQSAPLKTPGRSDSKTAASPHAAAGAAAAVDPARELTAIPQEPPMFVPDAWDPTGSRAGLTSPCRVWETMGWRYRGVVDDSVCSEWRAAAGKSRDGRLKATTNGADATIAQVDGAGTSTALHEECKPKACEAVLAVTFSPDGARVAMARAGSKNEVLVWSAKDGTIEKRLPIRKLSSPLKKAQLAWSDDDVLTAVLGGEYDAAAFSWDAAARAQGAQGKDVDSGYGGGITLDPWGRYLVHVASWNKTKKTSPQDKAARLEVGNGFIKPLSPKVPGTELSWTLTRNAMGMTMGKPGSAPTAAWSAAGLLAAWTVNGSQAVWTQSARFGDADMFFLRVEGGQLTTARAPAPTAIVMTSDGARTATARDRLLTVWNNTEQKPDFDEQLPDGRVSRIAFSADAKHVSVAYDDHLEVRGVEHRGVELFWAGVSSSAWSPRDPILAATLASGRVQVRDVASRSMLFETGDGSSVVDGSFSPDGRRFLTGSTGKIVIWDTGTWTPEQEIPIGGLIDVAWAPNGEALLVIAGNKITLWDVERTAARAAFTLPNPPLRVIWPPAAGGKEGAQAVVVSSTGDVTTYEVATGKVIRTLPKAIIGPMAISPDGKLAISGARSVRRLVDGHELTFFGTSTLADTGAFDGDPVGALDARIYRLGPDALNGALIPAGDLADQLRHPGLVRDFLDGKSVDVGHLTAPKAPVAP